MADPLVNQLEQPGPTPDDSSSDSDNGEIRHTLTSGRVVVHVVSARNVDPACASYVQVGFGKKKECTDTSPSDTSAPRWQSTMEFKVKKKGPHVVTLELYRARTMRRDNLLGVAQVDVDALVASGAATTGYHWLDVHAPLDDDAPDDADPLACPVVAQLELCVSVPKLRLTVRAARGIPRCSPYAFFRYGRHKFRTDTVKKTATPEWNQTFELDFCLGEPMVNLEVWDKGMIGSSFVGQVGVRIADFVNPDAVPMQQWLRLMPRADDEPVQGAVHVQLEVIECPGDLIPHTREVAAQPSLVSGASGLDSDDRDDLAALGAALVTVVEIEGVAESPVDPYVWLRYQHKHEQTAVKDDCTSVAYDESFAFPLKPTSDDYPDQQIVVEVWNKHRLSDTFLGRCVVDLHEVPLDGTRIQQSHALKGRIERARIGSPDEGIMGRVSLNLTFQKITIDVLRGRSLAAKDRGGRSDPYVIVHYADHRPYRTETKKKTLEPVWDEHVSFGFQTGHEWVRLDVWDKDVGCDDYLGNVVLRLSDFADGRPHQAWHRLGRNRFDDPVDGEILLRVHCINLPEVLRLHTETA